MERILIVGCGDIALRVAALLRGRYRLYGLLRDPERIGVLRAYGITPLSGDLDERRSLRHLAGWAEVILHFAPPPNDGHDDPRTRNLLAALSVGEKPHRMIYISTSGVYGDCADAEVGETRSLHPQTPRAQRRVDAERQIRRWARTNGVTASVLRVPGIYAADRLPLARLRAATPSIVAEEDGYTNHIHADDLARCVVAALRRGRANRIYHTCDASELRLGEYLDLVADTFELPRPPRLSRIEVCAQVSPERWSFMAESRRLDSTRMRCELGVRLRYPLVSDALRNIRFRIDSMGADS